MASPDDDIFINTGTTFQQQYVARVPTIGHVERSGQQTFQQPTVGQSHYTFAARNPFTYVRQGNRQTHYIANAQQAYPYIAASQTPYIANAQQAYPYIANSQTPYIANRQNAYPYIANNQTPYIANAQTPFTYQRQNPFTYRNPVNGQQHYIANARQPYIANARQPVRQPVRQPAAYRHPVIGNATRLIPDAQIIDASLYSVWTDSAFENNADSQAYIMYEVFYNTAIAGGRLEVLCTENGFGASGTTSNNRRVYWFNADHDVTIGGYTVRYTRTNFRQVDGEDADDGNWGTEEAQNISWDVDTIPHTDSNDTASGGSTNYAANPTAVPSGGTGNGLLLSRVCTSSCDGQCEDEQNDHFDINLIFEHATLPTYTFTAEWEIQANTDTDNNE